VDWFEQLRREHEFGIGTIAGVAAKFGVHRRVLRHAIGSALPPQHRYPARAKPKLGVVSAFIDAVLEADRQAPRKQRHTARRLCRRILTEFPDATVAESAVHNLEAHEHAFAYFGGVFHLLRYDNLASAVRKILRGYRREETVRFMAFRSRWRFAAEFCTPGEGHEKGCVEGEGGYFRRNHLVPVTCVTDLDALNTLLVTACRGDEARILDRRTETIGAAMAIVSHPVV
jgi:hypothetical protein